MLAFGNKEFRNLQEQVLENMKNIQDIMDGTTVLAEFGIKVIGQVDSAKDLPDADTYDGEYGDAYIVGTEEPYDYYIFTRAFEGDPTPQWFYLGVFPKPGPQGPAGQDGATGATGPRGPKGDKGDKGDTGLQGPQGAKGDKGDTGETGAQGPQGEPGTTYIVLGTFNSSDDLPKNPSLVSPRNGGYLVGTAAPYDLYVVIGQEGSLEWFNAGSVTVGPQGPQGPQGKQGLKGDQGDIGPRGPQGIQGEQGPRGYTGEQGEKGDRGEQGPQGLTGPQGDRGQQGPKGDRGDRGEQGPQGLTGPQGDRGQQGPKGDKGDTGPQGPTGATGAQGPKGNKGDPFAIYRTYASIAAMNADVANVPEGEFVLITSTVDDPDNAKLYVKGTNAFTYLTDMSGAQGIQGPQGETGATGATGPQGIQGEQGYTPYIDPTTGNWFINGTDTNVHAQGPRGLQGVQGIQGVQGATGAQGPQGPAGRDGLNGDTAAIIMNGTTYYPDNGIITLPDSSNLPEVDEKTIIISDNNKLATSLGGGAYTGETAFNTFITNYEHTLQSGGTDTQRRNAYVSLCRYFKNVNDTASISLTATLDGYSGDPINLTGTLTYIGDQTNFNESQFIAEFLAVNNNGIEGKIHFYFIPTMAKLLENPSTWYPTLRSDTGTGLSTPIGTIDAMITVDNTQYYVSEINNMAVSSEVIDFIDNRCIAIDNSLKINSSDELAVNIDDITLKVKNGVLATDVGGGIENVITTGEVVFVDDTIDCSNTSNFYSYDSDGYKRPVFACASGITQNQIYQAVLTGNVRARLYRNGELLVDYPYSHANANNNWTFSTTENPTSTDPNRIACPWLGHWRGTEKDNCVRPTFYENNVELLQHTTKSSDTLRFLLTHVEEITAPVVHKIDSQFIPIDGSTITLNSNDELQANLPDLSSYALKSELPAAVSGVNDGTNWTSLTIGSDTYGIGGGSAPSNMMTTDTTQTITGAKEFYYTPYASSDHSQWITIDPSRASGHIHGIEIGYANGRSYKLTLNDTKLEFTNDDDAKIGIDGIDLQLYKFTDANTYTYSLPNATGTLALTSNIPTNYITTNTAQTITGVKTFSTAISVGTGLAGSNSVSVLTIGSPNATGLHACAYGLCSGNYLTADEDSYWALNTSQLILNYDSDEEYKRFRIDLNDTRPILQLGNVSIQSCLYNDSGTTRTDNNFIKLGRTTLTETQLISLLALLNNN